VIRPLTDDEIGRLEKALGQPIERTYLAHWVVQAIQAFTWILTLPSPRDRRDDLKKIAEQGRKWIDTLEQSRTTPLLTPVLDVEQLMSAVRGFCDAVNSLARQLDQAVGPGHPRTNVALEALLEPLIGIGKRAKVLPSTPNRFDPGSPAPPFFGFVTEVLDVAMDVTRSSPLPADQIDTALAALSNVTDQSLVKIIEGLRGRIRDYREGTIGLVEWNIAADDERDRPKQRQSDIE
jgi:hypothetical protein